MAFHNSRSTLGVLFTTLVLFGVLVAVCIPSCTAQRGFSTSDYENIQVALNLEYLEAEYFLWAAYGYGLDKLAPRLTEGGPKPIGVQKANLNVLANDIIAQFGLQEIGHLTILQKDLGSSYFPRVQLNLSAANWANFIDEAVGQKLHPPFNPYANTLNFLISAYAIPYVGLTGYVGTIPLLQGVAAKTLVAGLLGVEAGQDAIIRAALYEFKDDLVPPYKFTVAQFTDFISNLQNSLSHAFVGEGLEVPKKQGADGLVTGNILSADIYSLSYARTAEQVLATVYFTGDAATPGGFFPKGASGTIAENYLNP
ncbi:unnamed protein product [Sphagnum jensenii]|uniref:Desiccation-related protein PCC13-62 n=1 Tax=Sphagnum jensenii TaxID=128206 RepID=A0ABP1ALL4_9BRYO